MLCILLWHLLGVLVTINLQAKCNDCGEFSIFFLHLTNVCLITLIVINLWHIGCTWEQRHRRIYSHATEISKAFWSMGWLQHDWFWRHSIPGSSHMLYLQVTFSCNRLITMFQSLSLLHVKPICVSQIRPRKQQRSSERLFPMVDVWLRTWTILDILGTISYERTRSTCTALSRALHSWYLSFFSRKLSSSTESMHFIYQPNAEHFTGITVILGLVRKELRDLWNYGTQEPSVSDVNPSPGA